MDSGSEHSDSDCSEYSDSDCSCDSDDSVGFVLQRYPDCDKPEFLHDVISKNMLSLRRFLDEFRTYDITFEREDEVEQIRACAHDKDLPRLCYDVAQYEEWDDKESSAERVLHVRSAASFFSIAIDTILKCNNHLLRLREKEVE